VQGVAGDRGGLGYFGFSYYEANKSKLNLLGISANGGQPIKPSLSTIRDGSYAPLSRPLFMYVNADAAERPEARAFLRFVLTRAKTIVEHPKVNYVALSDQLYKAIWSRLEKRVTGSMYADPRNKGKGLAELYVGNDQ
jgi:phosphate transport system substrate-binding protein